MEISEGKMDTCAVDRWIADAMVVPQKTIGTLPRRSSDPAKAGPL